MNKLIVGVLAAGLFVPVAVSAYLIPEGCGHFVTDLSTGSGGYDGKSCDIATLGAIGANTSLSTIERVDALKTLVNILVAQISLIKGTTNSPGNEGANCFVPTNDLVIGSTDAQTNGEVSRLQLWLKGQGFFSDATGSGYYGEKTAAAVVKWQKAHGMDFVTTKSGVGKMTRAKMQEECVNSNNAPVITAFTGPATLAVNQLGTWNASVNDADGDKLRYIVRWGDLPSPGDLAYPPNWVTEGLATEYSGTQFTHSFSKAGTYYISLNVLDASKGASKELVVTVQ